VGIQVEGRNDLAHIVVFDYPGNSGSPFRGGRRPGVSREPAQKGKTRNYRYRLIAYGGALDPAAISRAWKEFVNEF